MKNYIKKNGTGIRVLMALFLFLGHQDAKSQIADEENNISKFKW